MYKNLSSFSMLAIPPPEAKDISPIISLFTTSKTIIIPSLVDIRAVSSLNLAISVGQRSKILREYFLVSL